MNNKSLQVVNLTQLIPLLKIYSDARASIYLWGKPSSGKTSIVKQFAQEEAKRRGLIYSEDKFGPEYYTCKVFILSQCDSPDLRGMPKVGSDGTFDVTSFIPTEDLPRCGQGILFFDELNNADEMTQRAAYQLIQEGSYGNLPCLKDADGKDAFWRIAASNSEDDMCNVAPLPLALLRRFSHYIVEPTAEEVINYLSDKDLDTRVITYLTTNTVDLFPQKWEEILVDKKANPFPYQWERIATIINDPSLSGTSDAVLKKIEMIASGCVGRELAAKFKAHIVSTKVIDWKNVLNKDEKIVKSEFEKINSANQKASLLWTVIIEATAMWKNSTGKNKKITIENISNILKNIEPEFQLSFAKFLVKNCKSSQQRAAITQLKELADLVEKISKL